MEGCDSAGPVGLIKRRLKFDGRNGGSHDVDDVAAELVEGLRHALAVRWKAFQESRRQFFGSGVDPHEHGIPDPAYGREQSVDEVHEP